MANELTLVRQTGLPISLIVSDTAALEKGSIVKLVDPFEVSGANIKAHDPVGGIVAVEKIANDGSTQVAVFRNQGNIWKATASGTITVGDSIGLQISAVAATNENFVKSLNGIDASGSRVLGYSLETATTGQTFLFEQNITDGGR